MDFVLCDDNPEFLKLLRQRLLDECAKKDWNCTIALFTSEKALLRADLSAAQVIFLDIDMPDIHGLEVARRLRVRYPDVLLVFVTAFPQFAAEGYTVSAFRFLVKTELDRDLPRCLKAIWNQLFVTYESIILRGINGPAQVRLRDVLYIRGTRDRHVRFHLANTTPNVLECIGSLNEYEEKLAGKTFLHIKRGCFVNMYHVLDIKSYQALMDNGERLKVSRTDYSQKCARYILWRGQA